MVEGKNVLSAIELRSRYNPFAFNRLILVLMA